MGLFSGFFKKVFGWLGLKTPEPERGFKIEKSGTNHAIPVVYGFQKKVPVIKVLKVSSDASGGAWNDYLHLICIVCEGEVEQLGTVYFNDISEYQIDNERYLIERYNGSDTQSRSSTLAAEFNRWKTTSKLSGIAYLYVRLKINKKGDWWQGEPKITVDVKGKKVLDVRDNVIKYSQNPALCLYDYAMNARYGKGLADYKVDIDAIKAEADFVETTRTYREVVVNTSYDTSQRAWETTTERDVTVTENIMNCDVRLDTEKGVKENIDILLKGMRAIMPESNGRYKLTIEKEAQPVYAFTEDTLVGAIELDGGDQNERYNQVIIKFRNNLTGEDDEVTFPEDDALHQQWLAEDNDKLLLGEFEFPSIGKKAEALQMGHVIAHRSRQQQRVKLKGTPETVEVEAGDIVTVPSKIFGWTAKPFRIEEMEVDNETGECAFQAIEHQNTIYPWAISESIEEYADTSFALPTDISKPSNLSWTEVEDDIIKQGTLKWDEINDSLVTGYVAEIWLDDVLTDTIDIIAGNTNTVSLPMNTLPLGDYTLRLQAKNSLFYSDVATLDFEVTVLPVNARYIWRRFADDKQGNGISNNPVDKAYIGFAYNKSTEIGSNNPDDYEWMRFRGNDGQDGDHGTPGEKGEDGKTPYVHFAYATNATGTEGFDTSNATGKTYIGFYTDFIVADSTNPSDYTWTKIQGDKGTPGEKGENGQTSYVHFAYADNATGTVGFSTSDATAKKYIGTYVDFIELDSTNPNKYKWMLAKGEDGQPGTPGTAGADGQTPYVHFAYADNATGTVGFSTSDSQTKQYMGHYVDFNELGSTNPNKYKWTLIKGDKGDIGTPGTPGADGQTPYVHFAYATSSNGAENFSTSESSNAEFIGTYADFTEADSTNPADYKWTLIKGEIGTPGAPGQDGQTPYVHVAYATNSNGTNGFSKTETLGKTYIGTYVDFNQNGSNTPSDYKWILIKGERGESVRFIKTLASQLNHNGTQTIFINDNSYAVNGRGHTLVVLDPETNNVVYGPTRHDTYGIGTSSLVAVLNGVALNHIAILSTYDATRCDNALRTALQSFGSNLTDTWSASRVAHAFIGQKGEALGTAYESIASGSTNGRTKKEAYYSSTGLVLNGARAQERYSWTVYSDSTTSGSISAIDTTRTYIGVAHNQVSPTPNLVLHSVYKWYLALETIDLSNTNILVGQLDANNINVNSVFSRNITATGTVTGMRFQTSASSGVDRTIIDNDTIRHYSAGQTKPFFTLGATYNSNLSLLDLGESHVGGSDYKKRVITAYCDYDSTTFAANTFLNYGYARTLSLSNNYTGSGTDGTHGLALQVYSYAFTPLRIIAPSNKPPIFVNSTQRVANLNVDLLDGYHAVVSSYSPNQIPVRNSSGDIHARLFRSNYQNQSTIGGAMAFRNSTSDNYIRFCSSTSAIRNWLSVHSEAESDARYAPKGNTLTKSATAGIWRDKETGFTRMWGYINNGNASGDYNQKNFPQSFTVCYGVNLTSITTRNDGGDFQPSLRTSSSTGKDSGTYTNSYFRYTHSGNDSGIMWEAWGYIT